MTKNRGCTSDIGQSYTGVEPSKLVESDHVSMQEQFEIFEDTSYYEMWCLRVNGDKNFANTLHFSTRAEATYAKQFISNLIKKERETIVNDMEILTVYYRSKFSADLSRNETREERATEMIEKNDVIKIIKAKL